MVFIGNVHYAPLHRAVLNGNIDLVRLLLEQPGIDPMVKTYV